MPYYFFHFFNFEDPDTTPLGRALRKLRLERGLTQEEVARRAHLHRTHVGMIERGTRNATFNSIGAILTVLEVRWEDFGRLVDRMYEEVYAGQ